MANDVKEKVISFVCGDVTSMLYFTLSGILSDMTHFGIQVASTLIIGVAGGIAGMIGKDWLYPKIKRYLKRNFKQ